MSEFWRQNFFEREHCDCDRCGNEAAGRAGRSRRTKKSEDAATAADDDHAAKPRENWAAHHPPAPSRPALDSKGLTEPPKVVAMTAAAMQSGRGRLHGAILDDVTMQTISAAATAATVAALSQTSQREGAALGSINCGRPIDDKRRRLRGE